MPKDYVIASAARIVIYAVVLAAGFRLRRHHWIIGAAVVLVIASNVALMSGALFVSGLIAMPFAAVNAVIYLRAMRYDPEIMRALLASKESAWSRERHDLVNEVAAERAQADYYRRLSGH